MTREQAIKWLKTFRGRYGMNELEDAVEMAIKALEQESCETIKEIPKDYKYDTETKDFLVYRHMYTGHEIHIEKSVPRYRLEQQPCNDAISRQAVLEVQIKYAEHMGATKYWQMRDDIRALQPVTPQQKMGCNGCKYEETGNNTTYPCSHCGRCYTDKYKAESEDKLDGNPVDIGKAVEHYEGTLEALKDIDLEVDG